MIGGPDDAVTKAIPVLEDFARAVVHCGPLGAGMTVKIARNLITYGVWAVVDEAANLAQANNVSLRTLLELLRVADDDGGPQTCGYWKSGRPRSRSRPTTPNRSKRSRPKISTQPSTSAKPSKCRRRWRPPRNHS